jgi:hypothetical protein
MTFKPIMRRLLAFLMILLEALLHSFDYASRSPASRSPEDLGVPAGLRGAAIALRLSRRRPHYRRCRDVALGSRGGGFHRSDRAAARSRDGHRQRRAVRRHRHRRDPWRTSQGKTARALAAAIRELDTTFDKLVGGTAAFLIDYQDSLKERLQFALGAIALATFVLLFLMTGSVIVPVKAMILNLLSLGASFGVLVWGFKEGHLSGILNFDASGSIDMWIPIIVFVFAFGLSMDYEMFLLSRIKEEYDRSGDNDDAVAVGLQKTGRIVTSAAILIVVVFLGFATGELVTIKALGVGMALAIIVEASIVRMLLVPALMKMMGDRNWWAPAPMRRLHDRFGLHEPIDAIVAPYRLVIEEAA